MLNQGWECGMFLSMTPQKETFAIKTTLTKQHGIHVMTGKENSSPPPPFLKKSIVYIYFNSNICLKRVGFYADKRRKIINL
jgi:hypothetical protein